MCQEAKVHELADFQATSLNTLIEMVAGGIGMTLIPNMAAASLRPSKREIALRPLTRPRPHRTIGLAWRATSPRAAEFELLGRSLRDSSLATKT